ncbi:pentatricopeptide repeat-containing protein, putative [Ricinus communis]|uniref:Pentatricopeptide repeat-containing protein, putative n=1 Tax=Ricinus communis TaxID=3988 RepID=B9SAP1_RICCO|nr:pentatricopeptide repeat-containing protein, putative [Ricinus communis]
MRLFHDMKSKGIEPNVFTYSSLMDGLCKDGCSSQALELLKMMKNKRHKPNLITYNTLINGLYGKIINGLCENSKLQEAANFLDEMVLAGISPNRLTWSLHVRTNNIVVQGLCSSGDPNRAFQLYLSLRTKGDLYKAIRLVDEMVLDGCVPDQLTLTIVLCGFLDRRKV